MRKVRGLALASTVVGVGLLSATAMSHHSATGRFDAQSQMQLQGTVTRVAWVNPHVLITLETTTENGESEVWRLEAGSPSILGRAGIERGAVNEGDTIRVAGWPPLTANREMFVENVLSPAGRELLFLPTSTPLWTTEAVGDMSWMLAEEGDGSRPELGVYRVWSATFHSPFLFPQTLDPTYDMSNFPLTEAAMASIQNFNGATDNPTLNCNPKGMPTIMEQPYPMEIVDDGNRILIKLEEYDRLRTIHMNADAASAERSPSSLGYSVGRWEDNLTLVVETTDINWGWLDQRGTPLSDDVSVVERFELAEDGSRLDYAVTITDPTTFTEPITQERFWVYLPGIEVEPYNCQANESGL